MAKVEITSNVDKVIQNTELAIEQALEICGGMCESHAKDNLTAFPRVDTGTLRNSITHKVNSEDEEVYIGTNVDYGPYVEYGTGIYAEQGGRQTPWFYVDAKGKGHYTRGMKPSHFLRNALQDNMQEYQNVINDCLNNAVK